MDHSEARILALVTFSPGLSRGQVRARLGLPATTISSAVGRLLRQGQLAETPDPARRTTSGRRPSLLLPAGGSRLLGLVSWSPARLQTVLADFAGNQLRAWQHPAAGAGPLAAPLAALEQAAGGRMIAAVVSVAQPYQQGVGSPRAWPDTPDRRGQAGWLRLAEADPARAWSARLGLPVLFENDANLEAVGEAVYGAAAGEANVIFVKLGERTTGAGLVLDGRLYRGANGFAGELAHVHFADDGRLCQCGGRGCLSTRLGGALIESIHETYGPDITFADVLARADAGDPGPARILGDVGRMVGSVLANLVTFLNPSVLVIDGTLGPAARIVIDGLRKSVEQLTSPIAASALRIAAGTMGERAELLGAIAVAQEDALARASLAGSANAPAGPAAGAMPPPALSREPRAAVDAGLHR